MPLMLMALNETSKWRLFPEFGKLGLNSAPDHLFVLGRTIGRERPLIEQPEVHVISPSARVGLRCRKEIRREPKMMQAARLTSVSTRGPAAAPRQSASGS